MSVFNFSFIPQNISISDVIRERKWQKVGLLHKHYPLVPTLMQNWFQRYMQISSISILRKLISQTASIVFKSS